MRTTTHTLAKQKKHSIQKITPKITSTLALVLAALLLTIAPLAAAPMQQQAGDTADIADILTEPDDFEGETVSVSGYISNVNLGDNLFILSTDDRLRLDQLLVISIEGLAEGLTLDQQVTVEGTVMTFMPDEDIFVDLALEEEIADALLGRAVLVADSVDVQEIEDEAAEDEAEADDDAETVDDEDAVSDDDAPVSSSADMTGTVTGTVTTTTTIPSTAITSTVTMTGTADDIVVARIGEREITKAEFDAWYMNAINIIAARQGIPVNEETLQLFVQMQDQFLQQMVREQVLLDEAERRDISVSENDVQAIIDDIRAQFDTEEAYLGGLAQIGFEDEEQLRGYIVISETLQRVSQAILDEIVITDEEIEQFYDENPDLFTADGDTAALEDVQEAIRDELQRQAFEGAITQLEEDAGVVLMAENLGAGEDEVVTTGIPAEPVEETDTMTGTTTITSTTGITVTTDMTDTEASNLTDPEPMTSTMTTTDTDTLDNDSADEETTDDDDTEDDTN